MMPQISIPKKVVKQVKAKTGVYSTLNRKPMIPVVNNLIREVIEIARVSFEQYARAHNADDKMIKLEWNRFKKFLEKNL